MKTADQWLDTYIEFFDSKFLTGKELEECLNAIKAIQLDAWKQGMKDAIAIAVAVNHEQEEKSRTENDFLKYELMQDGTAIVAERMINALEEKKPL